MIRRPRSDTARRGVVPALLGALCITAAAADDSLGTFDSWSSMRFSGKGAPVCMLWSQPQKSEGEYTRRGEVFVFVTHRPGVGERNKVSFETGYTFERSSEVDVAIDNEKFTLYTDNSTAWTLDARDDARMVNAMRAGLEMVVKGTSNRGTLTTDTYSLRGFSAAHDAISKACRK